MLSAEEQPCALGKASGVVTADSGKLWAAAAVQSLSQNTQRSTKRRQPRAQTPLTPLGSQTKLSPSMGTAECPCLGSWPQWHRWDWGAIPTALAAGGDPHIPMDPSRGSAAMALRDLHPNKHHDVTLSKSCKGSP